MNRSLEEQSALNILPRLSWIHEIFKMGFWFDWKPQVIWEGDKPPLKCKSCGFYIPVRKDIADISEAAFRVKDDFNARKEVGLLKKSIIDESLPLRIKGILYWSAGRIDNVILLGEIKYSQAIPELLEILKHDYNYEMRNVAAESLGKIGKDARPIAFDLVERLLEEKDMYVRQEIAEALKKIQNPDVAFRLRDACEEIMVELESYEKMSYFHCGDRKKEELLSWGYVCFDNALEALFKCSKEQGREMISKALNSTSGHVYHGAKRAFHFSGMSSESRLIFAPEDLDNYLKKLNISKIKK